VGRTASGVRTGQTGEREPSRQSLRAPKVVVGKRAVRRIFTSDYKLSVLAEYDRCSEPGERGALLRREGLYSSLITDWRRQHREGTLKVSEGRTSEGGRGAPSMNEVARLRAKNERLKVKPRPKRSSRSREKCRRSWSSSPRARTTTTRRRHRRRRGRRARPGRGSRACLPGVGPLESDALSATPHPTATRPAGTTTSLASGTHTEPGR
jgi:transposase-like protein